MSGTVTNICNDEPVALSANMARVQLLGAKSFVCFESLTVHMVDSGTQGPGKLSPSALQGVPLNFIVTFPNRIR